MKNNKLDLPKLESITLGYRVFQGDCDTTDLNSLIMKSIRES